MRHLLALLLAIRAFAQVDASLDPAEPSGPPGLTPASPEAAEDALQSAPVLWPGGSARADSLRRALAFQEILRARERVAGTAFWRRLIPRIQAAASVGFREVVFHDLAGAVILPKDSYRVSASLSLQDLIDGSPHEAALLELERAENLYLLLLERQAQACAAVRRKRRSIDHELALLRARLAAACAIREFDELLFAQGKTDYRTLQRSRLTVILTRGSIARLEGERRELPNPFPAAPSPADGPPAMDAHP
jgi:hypothetical protein